MSQWRDEFNRIALTDADQARAVCGKMCDAFPNLPRLKTIASVGAYDAVIGGKESDSRRLTAAMGYLMRSGFLIDPDFEIDIVNFSDRRDFLAETRPADLVFVSFILRRHVYKRTTVYGDWIDEMARNGRDMRSVYGLALSPRHDEPKWRSRVDAADAKMVVTYGGVDEIGTHVLCANDNRDRMQPIIPTPSWRVMSFARAARDGSGEYEWESATNMNQLYSGSGVDVPMPWLGFAASPAYVKAVAETLSPHTMLGQRARAMALNI